MIIQSATWPCVDESDGQEYTSSEHFFSYEYEPITSTIVLEAEYPDGEVGLLASYGDDPEGRIGEFNVVYAFTDEPFHGHGDGTAIIRLYYEERDEIYDAGALTDSGDGYDGYGNPTPFRFVQGIAIRKTGFGNTCKAYIGVPTPDPDSFIEGSTLVEFDQNPYMARNGWGNLDGSDYPNGGLPKCESAVITHCNGITRTQMTMDYETPQFWGLDGQNEAEGLWLDENVSASSDLTEITFEVDYDSTIYVAYEVPRVAFQKVVVEKNGVQYEFKNVACWPKESWRQTTATFRMWGKTHSWGDGESYLTIPFKGTRRVNS